MGLVFGIFFFIFICVFLVPVLVVSEWAITLGRLGALPGCPRARGGGAGVAVSVSSSRDLRLLGGCFGGLAAMIVRSLLFGEARKVGLGQNIFSSDVSC